MGILVTNATTITLLPFKHYEGDETLPIKAISRGLFDIAVRSMYVSKAQTINCRDLPVFVDGDINPELITIANGEAETPNTLFLHHYTPFVPAPLPAHNQVVADLLLVRAFDQLLPKLMDKVDLIVVWIGDSATGTPQLSFLSHVVLAVTEDDEVRTVVNLRDQNETSFKEGLMQCQ